MSTWMKHGKVMITRRWSLFRNRDRCQPIISNTNKEIVSQMFPLSLCGFSSFSGGRRHWSSSAFFSTSLVDENTYDDDRVSTKRGRRKRNEISSLSSTTIENISSSNSSRNSNIFTDYEQLAMNRIVLRGGGIDEYQSIDVDSVVTEEYLQRLFDDHISHTTNNNKNNGSNNPFPPNPNMLLNMLEMLRNEEVDISDDTILKIFREVVRSKRVKLLERAEDVVVKKRYDPKLLRLLIAGYVNAGVPQRACKLLMEWPSESIQHQPDIKSYRLVLTALSSFEPKQQRKRLEKHISSKHKYNQYGDCDVDGDSDGDDNNNNNNQDNKDFNRHDQNVQEEIDREHEENNYHLAHRLLMHMSRNHTKFPILPLKPDRDCFHRVLGACTTIESLPTARQVLDDMVRFAAGKEVVDTTLMTITTMGTPGEEIDTYNSADHDDAIRVPAPLDTQPNISTTRLLVKGWAKASNTDKKMQKEAFEFLRKIEENEALSRQCDSLSSRSPIIDIDCYNVILNVVAEFGQYKLAESMFRRLLTDYLKEKSDIQPDTVTLNTVLKSHVQANTNSAAIAAEKMVQRLDDFYNQQEIIQNKYYHDEDGGISNNHGIITEDDRTEDKNDYRNSNIRYAADDVIRNKSHNSHKIPRFVDDIQPTARARSIILNLWVKLGNPHRAINILNDAEKMYRSKVHQLLDEKDSDTRSIELERFRPDKISYRQIIGGLSKLREPPTVALAVHAENIAERMSMMGHSLNIVTCNTILNCWTKSGNPDRAESFIEETMLGFNVPPDIISYNTIINGYGRLGNLNRCLEILTRLLDDSLLSNTDSLLPKPNSRTYTSILTALSRETTVKAAEEAEHLLLQMQELHDPPYNLDTRPNVITYNAVMNCWASLSLPSRRSKQLMDQDDCNEENYHADNNKQQFYGGKAEFVLRSMQGLNKDERPNVISYNTVIRAYSNDMNKAEELLQDMIENGLHPTEHTYDTLLHVLRRDYRIKNKKRKLAELHERYFPSSSFTNNNIIQGNNNNHTRRTSFSSNSKRSKRQHQ